MNVSRRSWAARLVRWFKDAFEQVQVQPLPLEFHLDTDEEGRHVARVFRAIEGQTTRVTDVAALCSYGFSVERGGRRYVLEPDDLEALLALRSTCSEIRPTGEIVCTTSPAVLKYLRQSSVVHESPSSQEHQVLDTPLEFGAKVDYDPQEGLVAEVGYRIPGQAGLWPASQVEVTPDGRYVRVGKSFLPLPRHVTQQQQEWLDKERQTISPSDIPAFFERDLVLLKTEMQAVLTERAAKVQVLELPPIPRVKVNADEPGWLDFQIGYVVQGRELDFRDVREVEGQTIRTDPETFVHVPANSTEPVKKRLGALGAQETDQGFRIPVERFATLEDFIEHIGGQREMDVAYNAFLDSLAGFEADTGFHLSTAAERDLADGGIHLRPYQRAGIHWLTWLIDHHLHGLLADDMGLGKTIQTAAALRYAWERTSSRPPSLIVCPKSVIRHWHRELKRCHPSLPVYEYIGSDRDRQIWQRSYSGVVISTYATVTRDVALIEGAPLFFLVFDESTRIKNPQAKRSQAIKALNAAHRIALSGTPVENRPAELWSVFDFLAWFILTQFLVDKFGQ